MLNRFLLWLTILFVPVVVTGCSDNDALSPEDGEYHDFHITDDLLMGKVVFEISHDDLMAGRYKLNTADPVDIIIHDNNIFNITVEDSDDGQSLKGTLPNAPTGRVTIVPAYARSRVDTARVRNFIFVVTKEDNEANVTNETNETNETTEASETRDDTNDDKKAYFEAYRKFVGQGTRCYGRMGNVTVPVLLAEEMPLETDHALFYENPCVVQGSLKEIHEHTFESMMRQWSLNVGLAGGAKGYSGSFSFGYSESRRESNDYEYYMTYYKVTRAEMKLDVDVLQNRVNKFGNSALEVLHYFNPLYASEIAEQDRCVFNTDKFYEKWGTDVITQGTLGGYFSTIFSREENVQEHSIGVDMRIFAKQGDELEKKPEVMMKWYDLFQQESGKPFWKANTDISYKNTDYFQASKSRKEIVYSGGKANIDNPSLWIKAFEDLSQWENWAPIEYAIASDKNVGNDNSDVAAAGGPDVNKWLLKNQHVMAKLFVDALEIVLRSYGKISVEDEIFFANAHANANAIEKERDTFLQKQAKEDGEKRPLIVCDIMMKYDKNRRKSGQPKPFVENNRTYYPLIANSQFDVASHYNKKMRGRPLDTNDDVFLASAHTGSHYWYYAMGHKGSCDGILDVKFLTQKEALDNLEYRLYSRRGDNGRKGSGLAVKERYVYLKMVDTSTEEFKKNDKGTPLVTAFGIYDSHHDYKNKGEEPASRIIASTAGADWKVDGDKTSYPNFVKFWNEPMKGYGWKKDDNKFYSGGGSKPHDIYPIISTKPLGNVDFEKLQSTIQTW